MIDYFYCFYLLKLPERVHGVACGVDVTRIFHVYTLVQCWRCHLFSGLLLYGDQQSLIKIKKMSLSFWWPHKAVWLLTSVEIVDKMDMWRFFANCQQRCYGDALF